jgi:hypothetical protein
LLIFKGFKVVVKNIAVTNKSIGEEMTEYINRVNYQTCRNFKGWMEKKQKTYNTGDSLVVTHPTTNPALLSLSMGERTGSRVF